MICSAANLLKPMLARGELRCIGATTLAEYRQHMEKDAAFERRFQQVLVGEPTLQVSLASDILSHYVSHGVTNHEANTLQGPLVDNTEQA